MMVLDYILETTELVERIKILTEHDFDPQLLPRWEKLGLFSGVQRGGDGRGGGKWVRYSEDAACQLAASIQMVHGNWSKPSSTDGLLIRYRFDKKVVAILREQALYELSDHSNDRELYPELSDDEYIHDVLRNLFRLWDHPAQRKFLCAGVDIWRGLYLMAGVSPGRKKHNG